MTLRRSIRPCCAWLFIFAILWGSGLAVARERAAGGDDAAIRAQYAPTRYVDITHVKIDVTPDFSARTVSGTTTITFTPIAEPLTELRLDAIDLNIISVDSPLSIAGYTATDDSLTITFAAPLPPGEEGTVVVTYDAQPLQGLYFRTPEMGYPASDVHLFSQGESHTAPYWYPNYDYPNERFTSEVICRVPPEMTVVSNGRLVSEQVDMDSGLKAVHWRQDKPHVNYLIALVAGNFDKIESRYRDIPLAFYTPPSQAAQAANSFKDTADMIAFFEQEIGIPYPWNKYDQAVVEDFVAGGMENTSLTILTDRTLHTDATENIRGSEMLVAHELAHQWFGDYVTCKDWSHTWLNEGFATYYEDLYDGHKNGRDSLLYGLYRTAKNLVRHGNDEMPIVTRHYENADDQFDYRAYEKGGWVLHMLRCQLGESLYRESIRTYLERYALGVVVTDDLRSVIEELSGRPFDRFFDQWLYQGGYPQLKVSYSWSEADKLAKVTVEQTQAGDGVTVFYLPAKIRFVCGDEAVTRDVVIDDLRHDFYFALEGQPDIVRFDPDLTLLADVTFNKPRQMLYAQLADESDVVGRMRAIDALSEMSDDKTITQLKQTLNHDPFYGVRSAAAEALQEIHTDEAFEALADSLSQDDARVRLAVVASIGRFYRPEVPGLLEEVLVDEANPAILASAIENLGRYQGPQTHQLVGQYLVGVRSYREELAGAAIAAIRMLDDASFADSLMTTLRRRENSFPSGGFAAGLNTLARICRNEDDRTQVREFLAGYVNDPKRNVQMAAISALGTLGDPKASAILETFAERDARDPLQRSAQRALGDLRETEVLVPAEVVSLREAVTELRKETDRLKEELADLKERSDAKDEAEVSGGLAMP